MTVCCRGSRVFHMRAIEFQTDLKGKKALAIPEDVAKQLPRTGKARVIVLFEQDREDEAWRLAAYEQFMRDDSPEDAVYDKFSP